MQGKPDPREQMADIAPTDQLAMEKRAFFAQRMILGVALVLFASVLAFSLFQERSADEQQARDRLSLGARSLALQVERRLMSIDSALLDLRTNLPALADDGGHDDHLGMHLKTLQTVVDGVRTFGVLDAQGNTLASSRSELVGKNFAHREFFQAVRAAPNVHTLYVSAPFLTSLGAYSLNLTHAIVDETGEFAGVVTATLDPEAFASLLAALRYTPDVSVGVIHGGGKVWLFSAMAGLAPDVDFSQPQSFFSRHIQRGEINSILSGISPNLPNERLAALTTINPAELSMSAPLIVTVSQETASILGDWHIDVRNQGLLFALLVALTVPGLLLYQKRQAHQDEAALRHQLARRQDLDRLRLATEVSETGIWELELPSRTLTWDNTMYRLFGKEKRDNVLTYADWIDSVLPEDREQIEETLRDAIDQRLELDALFRIRRGDSGEVRIIDARARVYYDDAGNPLKIIGVNRDITKRQEAEQSLRDSKEFSLGILDSLTSHIAVLDTRGTIMMVNQAWRDFSSENGLATAGEAYVGQNYLNACERSTTDGNGDEALAASLGIQEVLHGRKTEFSLEYPCHSPDVQRWFFMRVTWLRGAISGAVVSHENITARKQVERKLADAVATTQGFIDHLPGTAYVKDENLRVVLANRQFQSLLGLDPAAMIGKTNRELFPGNFGRKVDEDDRRVLATGSSLTIDEDYQGRFFESRKFVIKGENDRNLLGGITIEVTQRQKSFERQEALLEIGKLAGQLPEKEFLGRCLEMVEQLTGSSIGFIHFVNDDQQSIELVTWTPGALKGCSAVHESHYPIDAAGVWADCARTREPVMINDYPACQTKKGLPDGHAHLQRFISVPVIDEGRVRLILGVGNKALDYDEFDCATAQLIGNDAWRVVGRMRAEISLKQKLDELTALNARLDETNNHLLQSEKLASLGQLAAGVAHEINNPVGYVSSNLNTLSDYVDELLSIDALYEEIETRFSASIPEAFDRAHHRKAEIDHDFIVGDIRHLLDESREGLARVRQIVQDLKNFSRIGASGWEKADLHQGLESTLNIVWNEIKYKAEVDRNYGDLPEIQCIPSQINQVFLNLLTNAAQSITSHGHIDISSGTDDTNVWIEIRDNGSGISPDHLPRIFDPFFTTKPVGQGTGLGLSLTWGIIQRHHGQILVESEVGKGTCFHITLPIAQPVEPETDVLPSAETTP